MNLKTIFLSFAALAINCSKCSQMVNNQTPPQWYRLYDYGTDSEQRRDAFTNFVLQHRDSVFSNQNLDFQQQNDAFFSAIFNHPYAHFLGEPAENHSIRFFDLLLTNQEIENQASNSWRQAGLLMQASSVCAFPIITKACNFWFCYKETKNNCQKVLREME